MKKPRFTRLSDALRFIRDELPLLIEIREWQTLQQHAIDNGSSWDSE